MLLCKKLHRRCIRYIAFNGKSEGCIRDFNSTMWNQNHRSKFQIKFTPIQMGNQRVAIDGYYLQIRGLKSEGCNRWKSTITIGSFLDESPFPEGCNRRSHLTPFAFPTGPGTPSISFPERHFCAAIRDPKRTRYAIVPRFGTDEPDRNSWLTQRIL